jgi:hypothetical protein
VCVCVRACARARLGVCVCVGGGGGTYYVPRATVHGQWCHVVTYCSCEADGQFRILISTLLKQRSYVGLVGYGTVL